MTDTPVRVVPVQIYGQEYSVRSSLSARYVVELAGYVDEKMRAAAETTPSADALRLAVLAALNIADEFFRCRDHEHLRHGELAERAQRIERLVDEALAM